MTAPGEMRRDVGAGGGENELTGRWQRTGMRRLGQERPRERETWIWRTQDSKQGQLAYLRRQ